MSFDSNNLNKTPEECSDEENLDILYDSNLDDNAEIMQDNDNILQDMSFEEIVEINKENSNEILDQGLNLVQPKKITTEASSIHSYLQQQHQLIKDKKKQTIIDYFVKKYSKKVQIEKTQLIIE
ncbi:913_t:CDS:2 [Scutellospora calospora]|uniref:913_t:CDS:1 n=1 Tax=Scutellospora calospora TaxID=85575 RepID=A0ACA9NFX7_9GLOM|nr:913_t:CDS:2 [Scutellospora calospora]